MVHISPPVSVHSTFTRACDLHGYARRGCFTHHEDNRHHSGSFRGEEPFNDTLRSCTLLIRFLVVLTIIKLQCSILIVGTEGRDRHLRGFIVLGLGT